MRILLKNISAVSRLAMVPLGVAMWLGLTSPAALAQPANDNFANAEAITGLWGTVNVDTTAATDELPTEPSHAGFLPAKTVWYKFTAPKSGEMLVDTMGSDFQTVLAVYSGTNLTTLAQIAANDGANIGGSSLADGYFDQFGSSGPSQVRFNAVQYQTYYIVVGGGNGMGLYVGDSGNAVLNWAYHPSGSFRFASGAYVQTQAGDVLPYFECSETESMGVVNVPMSLHDAPGLVITVTRNFGSSGRVLVDYAAEDDTAVSGTDYFLPAGTLTFNDYEMSKEIIAFILPSRPPVIPTQDPAQNEASAQRSFNIVLSNPRLDPAESSEDVAPPRLDPLLARSQATILDVDMAPVLALNLDTNNLVVGPTNAVFNFEKRNFRVAEGVTNAFIRVYRSGTGEAMDVQYLSVGAPFFTDNKLDNTFALQASSDYATPDPATQGWIGTNSDYSPIAGTLHFGEGQPYADIPLDTYTDDITEFNEDFTITLWRDVNGAHIPVGLVNEAHVTILFNPENPPAGSVDELWNEDYNLSTIPPAMAHPGADGTVFDLFVQPDDKTIIVGDFRSYNTYLRNRIARINADGTPDTSFNPGDGANYFISKIVPVGGNFLLGGVFTFYNGTQRNGIARIFSNGSLDKTFNPGLGVDGAIWAIAVQSDGKILIGGEFTTYNGTNRLHIARLNADGSLDTTFDAGANAPDGPVNAIGLAADGTIIIGGEFGNLGSTTANNLAALNPDGTPAAAFNTNLGPGVDGPIYALVVQPNGRILIGGEFWNVGIYQRTRLARLNADGTLDTDFFVGGGADDTVYAINYQPNGKIYVGGLFNTFNGTRRASLTRLLPDGSVDTGFLDTTYNQFAGLPRRWFNSMANPLSVVYAFGETSTGAVMIGGGFDLVGGGRLVAGNQPSDQTFMGASEPFTRAAMRSRNNVARLVGGETPGPGNVHLLYDAYNVNQQQGFLFVSLLRTNGNLGFASANFSVLPGLAQAGVDFQYNNIPPLYRGPWSVSRMVSDGFYGTNTIVYDRFGRSWNDPSAYLMVSVLNPRIAGNRFAEFQLANPSGADSFYLGGANIPMGVALGRPSAPFTVIDDNNNPGVLSFSSPTYSLSEGSNLVVNVNRTGGTYGSVSVRYATSDGTAIFGKDYYPTNNTLTFLAGQTNKSFVLRTINNSQVQPVDRTLTLRLTSPSGMPLAPGLGTSNAVVSIVDDDYPPGFVNFAAGTFSTNEGGGALTLTITRTGGNKGTLTVQCGTLDGTAKAGANYVATTNTLQWNDGDSTPRYVNVPIIDNGLVGGDTFFTNVLFSATVNTTNAPTSLGGALTRSTARIIEDDRFGTLGFSAPSYQVNENGGYATVTIIRTGGSAESLAVNYFTSDATAVSTGILPNYVATSGTLNFAPGEVAKSFNIPILPDGLPDANPFFFTVNLTNATPAGVLAAQTTAPVYIIDTESYNQPAGGVDPVFNPNPGFNGDVYTIALQPDGRILAAGDFTVVNNTPRTRLARISAEGGLDSSFLYNLAGANGPVRTMLLQTDGRILIGGAFTTVDGIFRNRLARLVGDGNLDTSFNIGSGADNIIYALAETFAGTNRNILVGGSFNTVNGELRPGLARLNNDGALDPSFQPLSINGTVYAIAVYPTNTIQAGKILIGGDFTQINGVGCIRIARLNPDGSLDNTFTAGDGASDTVRALAIQLDGKVLAGGAFTNFNHVAMNRIARLTVSGAVDSGFNLGLGANDTVEAITVQPDNRILVVGEFTRASGVTRGRITRLLPDGTVDPSINFGAGADAFISAVALQPDGKILCSGGFTAYDGSPRAHLARIFGGSAAGSGAFEFTSPDYAVDETSTNALITLRRRGGTAGNMTVTFSTSPGTGRPGVNYSSVVQSVSFPVGETFQSVQVPIIHDLQITPDLTVNLGLSNALPPSGLGDQPVATLTIYNDDSTVNFSSVAYSRNENAVDGAATIHVLRQGSLRLTSTVEFLTTTNGTAFAYTNYIPVTNTLTFLPGDTDVTVKVPVLHDPLASGDRTVVMELTNTVNTLLFNPSVATLTIIDVDSAPGQFLFAATNYVVSEGAGFLPVNVLRTNGHTGVVSVNFATIAGTAAPGIRYVSTNGTLTFTDGETNKSFTVPIIQEGQVEGDQIFSIRLSNPIGGATIQPPTEVPVTVVDDDIGVGFGSPAYVALETAGAVTLTVVRQNGTNGITSVNYATTNNTAMAGTNYLGSSGTLVFSKGETIKSFTVSLLHDPRVTGDLSFVVNLSNPSAPAQLLTSSAAVVILDTDPGISFTNSNFGVLKSGTNVLITVTRTNANTGLVTVNYATTNVTAQAGIDYVPTSGTLTFSNGVAFQSFRVPIISNRLAQGDRTFDIGLFNPTGGAQLIAPSKASVVITDDISGLSFSAPAYSVNENGALATISVYRSNYTNSMVSIDYATADGTAKAGFNYVAVSGTLTFTNGETVKSFIVPVIDNSVVDGDQTVLLSLSNPVGNAVLVSPSAATLTIIETDGSLVLPAGSALTAESGPVNGSIDPGETVTMQLSLRNASGTNTANLVATLLATNGVTNPSGPQTYGVLPVHGPSAYRPFSFTANGTNGQQISVVLALQDGSTSLSNAVFSFYLGSPPTVFSNTTPIVINDRTNASPYASVINVSGLGGVVTKATVTLTNFNHTWPADVDVLLVSPTGQKSYLMARTGGSVTVSNLTLTFDDAAASSLPQAGPLVSGTYRPTSYAAATPPFDVPAPPAPYATNMSAFNGGNPNGPWSLFVIDDAFYNVGVISNGWILRLNTASPVSADVGVSMTALPEGNVVQGSNVTYTVTVANYGPSAATNVVVTNLLPASVTFLGATASQGSAVNAAGFVSWNVGTLALNASATLTIVVRADATGLVSNSATVTSGSIDLNPDDNTATVTSRIVAQATDLALDLTDAPDPLQVGDQLVYTIVVRNLGPATAPVVTVTDTLPSALQFISASPAAYTLSGRTLTFTNLGNLGSGAQTVATVTVKTLASGTITNTATCASAITDTAKFNNTASTKTDILSGPPPQQPSAIAIQRQGNFLIITWPLDPAGYTLESAASLESPAAWSTVNVTPVPSGGQNVVTLPLDGSARFFRLHWQ